MKELDHLYDCLGKLEEAYCVNIQNHPENTLVFEAQLRLNGAIAEIAALLVPATWV